MPRSLPASSPDAAFATASTMLYDALVRQSRGAAIYSRTKVAGDPLYRVAVARIAPGSTLLDVGGGFGTVALLHALVHGGRQERTVVDWDERKLALGEAAAQTLGLPVRFVRGDVHELPLHAHDEVICADVLHYVTADEQDRLLDRMAALLRPGGQLLVRDMDRGLGWRSGLTWIQERLSLLLTISRGAGVHARDSGELVRRLEARGLAVQVEANYGSTPFANVLVLARRPA